MQRRNMQMIDCADIVIAVWDGSTGGTKNAVDYAEESGLKIIFIDPNDFDAEVEVEKKPAPAPSEKKAGVAARLNRITGKK
jgi:precorrin-6x reductase